MNYHYSMIMHRDRLDSMGHHEWCVRLSYRAYCEYKYFLRDKQSIARMQETPYDRMLD